MNFNIINLYSQAPDATAWSLETNNLSGNLSIVANHIYTHDNCAGTGLKYQLSPGTSSEVYLKDNKFQANVAHATDGIYVENAKGFITYCDNEFINNKRGLVFNGDNLNNNVMYSIFDENDIGLELEQGHLSPTEIGRQIHHQNDWLPSACNNCSFEAFAVLGVDLEASRFFVDPSVDGFRPNPLNQSAWFQNQNAVPEDTPQFCPAALGKVINDLDYLLVESANLFLTDDIPSWHKKIYLYQKLAPYIYENNEVAELFGRLTEQLSDTDIQLFDLPFALKKAIRPSTENRAAWNTFNARKVEIMENITILDKQILDDNLDLIEEKIELVHDLTELDSLENELIERINTQRKASLDEFITGLNNITVNQNFKKNEVQYYHALAHYLKNKRWKSDIYDMVKKLAESCYQEDGQVVLQARALLHLCDLEEIEDCAGNRTINFNRLVDKANPINIDLFPNPNGGEWLYLKLPELLTVDSWNITITDLSGKTILTQQMPATTHQAALDIGLLNNGLYFISIDNGKDKVIKKLTIQKK